MTCIQAIVFDMDGILVDTPQIHRQVWQDFVVSAPWQEVRDYAPGSAGRRSRDVLTECIGSLVSAEGIDDIVDSLHRDFLDRCVGRDLVFPKMREVVEVLAGAIPMALATSAPRYVAREMLGDLFECFDGAVTSDECSSGKPDPEVYLRARAVINATHLPTLALEDTAIGVASAVAASCVTWAVSVDPIAAPAALRAGARLTASTVDDLADLLMGSLRVPEAVARR